MKKITLVGLLILVMAGATHRTASAMFSVSTPGGTIGGERQEEIIREEGRQDERQKQKAKPSKGSHKKRSQCQTNNDLLQKENDRLRQQNRQLMQQNASLQRQVKDIQNGSNKSITKERS